jgi:hypothetical protein
MEITMSLKSLIAGLLGTTTAVGAATSAEIYHVEHAGVTFLASYNPILDLPQIEFDYVIEEKKDQQTVFEAFFDTGCVLVEYVHSGPGGGNPRFVFAGTESNLAALQAMVVSEPSASALVTDEVFGDFQG